MRVGVSLVDQSTGMWAALAILAALARRGATGAGATLDLSLYEIRALAGGLSPRRLCRVGNGPGPARHGVSLDRAVSGLLGLGRRADGRRRQRPDLLGASARRSAFPTWPHDPRFATNEDRVANRDALVPLLAAPISSRTNRATWLERFAAANVPAAPVQDIREVAEHPQTDALGLFQLLDGLPVAGLPFSVDGERVAHRSAAPSLGRDTAGVLREAGYSEEAIRELAADGVIRVAG